MFYMLKKKKKIFCLCFKSKYFCNIAMPSGEAGIFQFNQSKKLDKARFIIYEIIVCMLLMFNRKDSSM